MGGEETGKEGWEPAVPEQERLHRCFWVFELLIDTNSLVNSVTE